MDHLRFLCSISEMNWIFTGSNTVEGFLDRIVKLVASHMQARVCSIYTYDDLTGDLLLRATVGLAGGAVGNVRLKHGEGLTGLAVEELRPINLVNASGHPRYRFFEGIGEEQFDAFLAVPIMRGINRVGALNVQRQSDQPFTADDVAAMGAISSQLANIIENARILASVRFDAGDGEKAVSLPSMIKGRSASPGVAIGELLVLDNSRTFERYGSRHDFPVCGPDELREALAATEAQLQHLQAQVEARLTDAASLICSAHLLMLKDENFAGRMLSLAGRGVNAPAAVMTVGGEYARFFAGQGNAYLKEKAADVQDLVIRLMANLLHEQSENVCRGKIVVAGDLFPSDVLRLAAEGVAGVVLIGGGVTSHLSIFARALGVPLVIADETGLLRLPQGTPAALDADQGNIFVNPASETADRFNETIRHRKELASHAVHMKTATVTRDGRRIGLLANVNLLGDLLALRSLEYDGIGLYRTEFPFLVRAAFPDEEEQYAVYRRLVENVKSDAVITFRTLDIGGDKVLPYYRTFHEKNPFLGIRSIRFSLQNLPIFKQQLRAILRAAAGTQRLRILFPMIASLEELSAAKAVLAGCIDELNRAAVPHHEAPETGVMVEIPSAVELAEELIREVDFFSIGSNDLIQYMLAVDRTNEKVADLYCAHHPAVLRSIKRVIDAAHRQGKEAWLCGDMAHTSAYLAFLIGAGIDAFSVDPKFLPEVQNAIGRIDSGEAEVVAARVLEQSSISGVEKTLGFRRFPLSEV